MNTVAYIIRWAMVLALLNGYLQDHHRPTWISFTLYSLAVAAVIVPFFTERDRG